MLFQQHRQGGETAAVPRVDQEQHHKNHPQCAIVNRMEHDLQQADGNGHHENHHIAGFAAAAVVGQRGKAQSADRVEHRVNREDRADHTGGRGGEGSSIKPCEARHHRERIMQNVLLLRNQRKTTRDIEVEGEPDRPEHRAAHHRATPDTRGGGVHVACGAAD